MSGPRPIKPAPALKCFGFGGGAALAAAVDALAPHGNRELLPLSTCRRHELWVISPDRSIAPWKATHLGDQTDAAARLVAIAAGALSDVPGEIAVADQVRLALRRAARHALAGAAMTRLVRAALEAGRVVRDRVRDATPILELPDLVAELVLKSRHDRSRQPGAGEIMLLGSGPAAKSIHQALRLRGISVHHWATRRPSRHDGPSLTLADARARAGHCAVIIAALAGDDFVLRASDLRSTTMSIDVGVPGNIEGPAWPLPAIIRDAAPRLAPQAEAMSRAAHRIPALAEAALAEAISPSIALVAGTIAAFRATVVRAELARLAPMLMGLPEDVAERIRRSIVHTAARSVHPMHELVNQLGRQNRAQEAVTLVDHLLGSRVGFLERAMNPADAGKPARGRRPRR